jgi:hypothetical protein
MTNEEKIERLREIIRRATLELRRLEGHPSGDRRGLALVDRKAP